MNNRGTFGRVGRPLVTVVTGLAEIVLGGDSGSLRLIQAFLEWTHGALAVKGQKAGALYIVTLGLQFTEVS